MENLKLLRCKYYLKQCIELLQSPSKSQWHVFSQIEKPILKFGWNLKGLTNQNSSEKEEQNWRHHISRFKNLLQSYSNQNHGSGIKTDIWNSGIAQSPDINLHTYDQIIFDKNTKIIQWGKRQSVQQLMLGKLDVHIKMKLDVYLTPCKK